MRSGETWEGVPIFGMLAPMREIGFPGLLTCVVFPVAFLAFATGRGKSWPDALPPGCGALPQDPANQKAAPIMDALLPFPPESGRSPGQSRKLSSMPVVLRGTHGEHCPPRQAWRVLILSHMFPHPKQRGLGPFILEQVRALRRHGKIDARVVCCQPFWVNSINPFRYFPALRYYRKTFASLRRWQSYEEVPVLYLPYLVGSVYPYHVHGRTYQEAVLRAAPFIRQKFPFQVVHAHTSYLDGTAGLALSQQYEVPFFITEHTGPFSRLTEDERVRRQTLAAIQGASQCWCVSTALADQVKGNLPVVHDRIAVLPNGVDTAQFRPPQHWAPDPARPKLLAVMSLDENKNPLLLLHAFQRLRQTVPGATMTLVGTGPLEEQVRQTIVSLGLEQVVRLPGHCSRLEVARLMREECDVFVLCSTSETFGVVLIEALACGKPAVATRCGGPTDVITSPGLGRLCDPRNLEGLSAALSQVVLDLPAFDGAFIRQQALDRFAYRKLASSLCLEYDRALEARGVSPSLRKKAA
jgi:glycosyltransferase involved in cell wall biosynthesis